MPKSKSSSYYYGQAPYMGQKVEIWVRPKQWANLKKSGDRFWINAKTAANNQKLNEVYNSFCRSKLKQMIKKQVSRLKYKNIYVNLPYTDGQKNFLKKIKTSVASYLKMIKYSSVIDIKIGKYTKEWGINAIDPKKKKFTLYFNQDLIKYDSGKHIQYVTAHELTHVFHRDHGPEFNRTLQNMYSSKNQSESFFKKGIAKVFATRPMVINTNWIFYGIMILGAILIIWFLFGLLGDFFGGFDFDFNQRNNQSNQNF